MVARRKTGTPTKRQADDFEQRGNFKVNFRRLGQRLAELHNAPGIGQDWPYVRETPISSEEQKALHEMALEHLRRHDLGTAPMVPQCSDDYARPCRAMGAAQVVLSLLWAPGEEQAAEPARRLDKEARKLESAVSSFLAAADIYLQARAARHASHPWACVKSHPLYCVMPARVADGVGKVQVGIAYLRAKGLVPQFPEYSRGSERLGLLKEAEARLYENRWTLDEIIAVLDDRNGGNPRARKDRLRKRLGPAKERSAPRDPPIRAR